MKANSKSLITFSWTPKFILQALLWFLLCAFKCRTFMIGRVLILLIFDKALPISWKELFHHFLLPGCLVHGCRPLLQHNHWSFDLSYTLLLRILSFTLNRKLLSFFIAFMTQVLARVISKLMICILEITLFYDKVPYFSIRWMSIYPGTAWKVAFFKLIKKLALCTQACNMHTPLFWRADVCSCREPIFCCLLSCGQSFRWLRRTPKNSCLCAIANIN